MPFGLSPSSASSSRTNMHALDAEILAAIDGGGGSSSSSSSSVGSSSRGALSPRSSSRSSSSASLATVEDSSGGGGGATRSGGAGTGGPFEAFHNIRSGVKSKLRASGTNKRQRRALTTGLASLGLLAVLALSSGGGGGRSSFISDARALTRGSVPPSLLHHLADLDAPDSHDDDQQRAPPLPVFWHVLKSGGTALQDLAEDCFALRVASEVGGTGEGGKFGEEDALRVVEVNEGHRHVNVDTTTSLGIQRAAKLKLAESGLADILFTPLLVETSASILSPQHRGRMFALFRHPVHRAVSQFYYLRGATWEPTYNPAFGDMTLQQWASTDHVESNWMVRSLVNKMEGPLSDGDLESAKEIVRQKCVVGLLDEMEESVARFRAYFGFGYDEGTTGLPNPDVDRCVAERLGDKSRGNRSNHPFPLEEGDATWAELEQKNGGDMALYEYAKMLFAEQKGLVEKRAEARRRRGGAGADSQGRGGEEGGKGGGKRIEEGDNTEKEGVLLKEEEGAGSKQKEGDKQDEQLVVTEKQVLTAEVKQ